MHWDRKPHSAGRLASGRGYPSICWPQRRRRPRDLWRSLWIATREATDKLGARLALSPGIDCHVTESFRKIILVIVALTSRRTGLVFARVHGGSGSSGTPHSRVPLLPRAPLKGNAIRLFTVVYISITAPRSLHRFSSGPPLCVDVPVVRSGEYPYGILSFRLVDETHWALNNSDGNALHSVASGGLETR